MARRKGKSQRRIKDWHRRFQDSEGGDSPEAVSRQKVSQRAVKLPPWRLEAPTENLQDLPKIDGMVLGLFPGGALVGAEERRLVCGIAKTFRAPPGASPLAVGDHVTVALAKGEHADSAAAGDHDRADGMVIARQPRQSLLARPQPRSGKRRGPYDDDPFLKVVVANMDVLLIVVATRQPPLRQGLIDRFLIIAERGELQPIVVINKIDLAEPDQAILEHRGGNPAGQTHRPARPAYYGSLRRLPFARRRVDRRHAGSARTGYRPEGHRAELVLSGIRGPGWQVPVQRLHTHLRAGLRCRRRRPERPDQPATLPELSAYPRFPQGKPHLISRQPYGLSILAGSTKSPGDSILAALAGGRNVHQLAVLGHRAAGDVDAVLLELACKLLVV